MPNLQASCPAPSVSWIAGTEALETKILRWHLNITPKGRTRRYALVLETMVPVHACCCQNLTAEYHHSGDLTHSPSVFRVEQHNRLRAGVCRGAYVLKFRSANQGDFANSKRRRRRERRRTISPCGMQYSQETFCFALVLNKIMPLLFSTFQFSQKSGNKKIANITNKENTFLALDLKLLWCKRSHGVRFYVKVHAYVYVSNFRNLPIVLFCGNVKFFAVSIVVSFLLTSWSMILTLHSTMIRTSGM